MPVSLQTIRALPGYEDYSDDDIVQRASALGIEVTGVPEKPEPEEPGAFRSYVSIPTFKGIADVGGTIGYGLEQAERASFVPLDIQRGEGGGFQVVRKDWNPETDSLGRKLQESNFGLQNALTGMQSQAARKDAQKTLFDKEGNYGGYNFGTLAQDALTSLPGTAAMGLAGAPIAGAVTGASKSIGAGKALGKLAGSGALGKALTKGFDKAIGSSIGFGASEGAYSAASNASQIQDQIRRMSADDLAEHPMFWDIYDGETDPALSVDERLHQAREISAQKAGDQVFADTFVKTGGISALTGGGMFGMMRAGAPATDGLLKTLGKGFVTEGLLQEAPQSGLERKTTNQALNDYANPNQDVMEGVWNDAGQGGLVGGALGLGGGLGARFNRRGETEIGPITAPNADGNGPGGEQAADESVVFEPNQAADESFDLQAAKQRRDDLQRRIDATKQALIDADQIDEAQVQGMVDMEDELASIDGQLERAPKPASIEPSKASKSLPRSEYDASFQDAADKHGVPVDLLKALATQESGIRQFDKNGKPLTPGTSNALGIMQVIPRWHPEFDAEKLANDPDYNINAGAQFLGRLLKKHRGNAHEALQDYYGSRNDAENKKYADSVLARIGGVQIQTGAEQAKTSVAPEQDLLVNPESLGSQPESAEPSTSNILTEAEPTPLARNKAAVDPATVLANLPSTEIEDQLPSNVPEPSTINGQSPFTATHELSDGTAVARVENNVYRDADGNEYQDNYAEPIQSTAQPVGDNDRSEPDGAIRPVGRNDSDLSSAQQAQIPSEPSRGDNGHDALTPQSQAQAKTIAAGTKVRHYSGIVGEAIEPPKFGKVRVKLADGAVKLFKQKEIEINDDTQGNQEATVPQPKLQNPNQDSPGITQAIAGEAAEPVGVLPRKSRKSLYPKQILITASGRQTTPHPGSKLTQKADQWLLKNAVLEAQARGDEENAQSFRSGIEAKAIPEALKDAAKIYLFGQQEAPDQPLNPIIQDTANEQIPSTPTPPQETPEQKTVAGPILSIPETDWVKARLKEQGIKSGDSGYAKALKAAKAQYKNQFGKSTMPSKKAIAVGDHDDLLSAISKLGGLNRDEALAQGIDPAGFSTRGHSIKRVFTKAGRSYDEMAELLRGYHFKVQSANDLVGQVSRAVNQGEKLYTPKGYERIAELKAQERYDDEQAQVRMRLEDAIEAGDITVDDLQNALDNLDDLGIKQSFSGEEAISALNDFFGIDNEQTTTETSAGSLNQEALQGYTERDIADRAAADKQRADRERAEQVASERKAKADRERDSLVDEMLGTAPKTQDVFGMPDPLENINKRPEVSDNKIFTDEAASAARDRLKKKLGTLNSGLDPEAMLDGITLAGWHIEKGARSFAAYSKAMIADLGVAVKPYLKSWYMGVKYDPRATAFDGMDSSAAVDSFDLKDIEEGNASITNADLESDRANAKLKGRGNESPVSDGRQGTYRSPGSTSADVETEASAPGSDRGNSINPAATRRKRSHQPVHSTDGPAITSDLAPGVTERERSGNDSNAGIQSKPPASAAIKTLVEQGNEKTPAAKRVIPQDADNIAATLPILNDGQKADVLFAEKRLADHPGVLFTNGTGTGKTFSALGIIKRLAMRGKNNIIIVVPSANIADQWTKAANSFFDLNITQLGDSKSSGKGVVITTYANFGMNNSLASRNWDMVVADESHKLMQSENGDTTDALNTLRGITYHRTGFFPWFNAKYADIIAEYKALAPRNTPRSTPESESKYDKIEKRYIDTRQQAEAEYKALSEAHQPKVVFLSATPFAYVKTIDYAEGYLFHYSTDKSGLAYNSGNNQDQFFMQHFGYRMRYNKLTRPDTNVDTGMMERQFNSTLRKTGALSFRTLDVDYDYDRKFILTESAIGQRIDQAMEWVREKKYRELAEELSDKFDHLQRRYLLESIKAKESIDIVKQHLALGRKVLVFHDYKKGGAANPFIFNGGGDDVLSGQIAEFNDKFGDLARSFKSLPSPIEAYQASFGNDVMIYNGDVKSKDRIEIVRQFNDDTSGKNLVLVQSASAKEGVSFHDTTGKHQRVLINLGLPTQPTTAIQQEGRIYRVGQKSDALFRYLNTGTNWERWAFASTIAQRASTAENLGAGEAARGLKDAFINGFEASDTYAAGHEREGKGGKEADHAAASALTEFDRAKTLYYGQQKKTSRNKSEEGIDYFATPEPVGLKMAEIADIRAGDSVLEPSAGHGAIARWFRDDSKKTAVEPSGELSSRLALVFDGDIKRERFEDLNIVNKYDAIVMNPPFGSGGKTAIEHLAKAVKHLRMNGRIVALLPDGPAANKRLEQYLESEDSKGVYLSADISLPQVTFERAGTTVKAHIVVIDRASQDDAVNIQQQNRDYSDAESINELFDRIENLNIHPRIVPEVAEETNPSNVFDQIKKADAKAKDAEKTAQDYGVIAAKAEDATFELKGDKIVTNAPAVQITTKKGKVLDGVLVPDETMAKAADDYTYQANGRGNGWFVRLRHIERPANAIKASIGVAKTGSTVANIKSWLPKRVKPMLDAGKLRVEQSAANVPKTAESIDVGGIEGFYDPAEDVVYLIADNITQDTLQPTLAHELLHRAEATDPQLKAAIGRFENTLGRSFKHAAEGRGSAIEKSAYRRVIDAGTAAKDQAEEYRAYLVTEYSRKPDSFTGMVRKAIEDFIAAIRAAMIRSGLDMGFIRSITPADLAAMSRYGVNVKQRVGNGKAIGVMRSAIQDALSLPEKITIDGQERWTINSEGKPIAQDEEGVRNFWRWFGGSKVVDKKGKPLVVYHGTDADITSFDKKITDDAFWFTKYKKYAAEYAKIRNGKNIFTTYLKADKVFDTSKKSDRELFEKWADEDGMVSNDGSGFATGSKFPHWENNTDLIRRVKRLGYDALITSDGVKGGYDNYGIGVFESNQIKSATDNIGDFNPDNPDIKFSRASNRGTTGYREWLSEDAKASADNLIYNLQDRFIDLKEQMKKVVKSGGVITESQNPYMAEELSHQRIAARVEDFYDNEMTPVLQGLHKYRIGMEAFQKFLHARHAPSRNRVMAERNPNQAIIDQKLKNAKDALDALRKNTATPARQLQNAVRELNKWRRAKPFKGTEEQRLSLSGMSDADAKSLMDGLHPLQRKRMTEMADKIDEINNKTLDLMVAYGMETPDTIQALKDQWEHYVPLHRDEAHPDNDNFGHPIGRGFSVRGSGLKTATGSNAEVTNILAHIAAAREQMIRRGEKTRVTTALANFIHAHPDTDFVELDSPPMEDVLVNGLVESRIDPLFKQRDNVVTFRVGGKDKSIVFNERNPDAVRLALSWKNLDGVELDKVERVLARATRWFASVNTQYNVIFGLINLARDTQGMMLNLTSTPLAGKQMQVFKRMGKTLPALYGVARGAAGVDPAMKAMVDRFKKSGGTTGYMQMFGDITERNRSIEKQLNRMDVNGVQKLGSAILQWLNDYNSVMENSTRLAVFMAGIESGLSDAKAASIAKNITVNFNRKGAYTTKIGAFYAFFNASMQGTARLAETLSGPKGPQILTGGVLLGAAMAAIGIAAMGDDGWEDIPEFIRERSLIVPLSNGKYFAVPMPLGFHILPNIGRKVVELAFGSKRVSPTARLGSMLATIGGGMNPLGSGDFGQIITPTAGDPIVALWRNKDWTGRRIYREDFNTNDPTPGFTRTKDSATGFSKVSSEIINKATGGTDYRPGYWSPTPDQIDYVLGQLAGGTGRELAKAEQTIEATIAGDELPLYKVPLVGRLIGDTRDGAAERSAYYDNLKRLNLHHNEMVGLRSEADSSSKINRYMQNNPDAILYNRAHEMQKQIDAMSKRRKLLKQRGENTREIDDMMAERMKRLNDAVDARLDGVQ